MSFDSHVVRLRMHSSFDMLDVVQLVSDRLSAIAGFDEDATHWVSVAVRESVINAIKHGNQEQTGKFVMVEAETPEQALEAVRAGADGVLFDNFTPERARAAYDLVKSLRPDVVVEVSGGVTLDNVGMYAAAADRVSLGALTHSAPALDVSLDVEPAP